MKCRPWTAKEVRELDRLRADGLSVPACAAALGRTVAAVCGQVRRSGLSGRWTAAEDARLRAGWTDGESVADLAAELGRTTDGVNHRRRLLRLPPRPLGSRPNAERRAVLMGYLGDGLSLTRAAKLMGVDLALLCRTARRMVAEGILVRLGTRTGNVRYVPTHAWTCGT